MTRVFQHLVAAAVLGAGRLAAADTIAGVATAAGQPAADAVVYLESAAATVPHAPPAHVVMDQRNLSFVPAVLPVVRGTVIEFTNSDDVQHNVFSPSTAPSRFDLGTYGPKASRTVTANELGDVLVLCNIHMEMEGHILVLKDPYFAVVRADGRYQIADVPPGSYTLRVWHHHFLPETRSITVVAGTPVAVDLQLSK